MSEDRRQSIRVGLERWVTWVHANNAKSPYNSSLGSLYEEAVAYKRGDFYYKYQTYNYQCPNCEKQYMQLPLDRQSKPQNRCTRCAFTIKKVNEGITGRRVFAGMIPGTGFNKHDPIAEIYNEAINKLPYLEKQAILWKYLSAIDQKSYAEKLNISVQQLQQILTRSYHYLMGYMDANIEIKKETL